MVGLPERTEAAPYYFTYIDRVTSGDIVGQIETQLDETLAFLRGISEEKSLHRYAPDKWSIREVLNHISDCERLFVFRALWFARGFDSPLPSFDQNIAVAGGKADELSWARHIEEFRAVRVASIAFFRNLPPGAWMREGIASGNKFTVRALAYVIAGHVTHHRGILEERYL
jgi:uncharacterized damage-inducible protein DinB